MTYDIEWAPYAGEAIPCDSAELDAFEAEVGASLPQDYRDLLAAHAGEAGDLETLALTADIADRAVPVDLRACVQCGAAQTITILLRVESEPDRHGNATVERSVQASLDQPICLEHVRLDLRVEILFRITRITGFCTAG